MVYRNIKIHYLLLLICSFFTITAFSQSYTLSMRGAIDTAMNNYAIIQAKKNYISAGEAQVQYSKLQAIPDLSISAQNNYGTINNIYGPGFSLGINGTGGLSSSGPMLASQNWNAAYGGLYLASINWDFYSFGKIKAGVNVARKDLANKTMDLNQEVFQDKVKVCAAYLNLLGAQQLTKVATDNLNRAIAVKNAVVPRVLSGLNPGVDSSLAVAEVSNAKMAMIRAKDNEIQLANYLIQYLGIRDTTEPILDTMFITRIPSNFLDSSIQYGPSHPLLQFYNSKIDQSRAQEKYIKSQYYPTFKLFSTYQSRASGFGAGYSSTNLDDYTTNYWKGIGRTRQNYLVGIGMVWDLSTPFRLRKQLQSQQMTTSGLRNEYARVDQQLNSQVALANAKVKNSLINYKEVPTELNAATQAFIQKTTLYKNGLNTIIDVTQALYAINKAETDKYIAFNNVWQALLLKAASTGDFDLFLNEF